MTTIHKVAKESQFFKKVRVDPSTSVNNGMPTNSLSSTIVFFTIHKRGTE